MRILLAIAFLATVYGASASICAGKPDGVVNWGCRSYTTCLNGTDIIIECKGGNVYNQNTQVCDDAKNVPAPCGTWRNCTTKEDGLYPDSNLRCEYFYTCLNEQIVGHNPCPTGLVFNSELQLCDWPYNVAPPCGTKKDNPEPELPNVGEDIVMYLDCSGKPDGVYEWGCKAYTMCKNQEPLTIECKNKTVYNQNEKRCSSAKTAPAPCGIWRNCTGVKDGQYADIDRACKFFYTCYLENFFGHNPCPAGLVFNQELQICDWAFNVPPPCGTKKATKHSLLRLLKKGKIPIHM